MASGSEDYWMTTSRLLADLMQAIKDSLITGSDLLNKLDNLNAISGGKLDLSTLTDGATGLLAKLLGVSNNLITGSNLLDKLDALDGTMDGKLDLSQLNSSSVKTNLDTVIARLDTSITKLIDSLTQLIGVHDDTTAMINFAQDDWGGVYIATWTLVSSINNRRISLRVTTDGLVQYSRDGSTNDGSFSGTAYFYDVAGVWIRRITGSNYTATEISAN